MDDLYHLATATIQKTGLRHHNNSNNNFKTILFAATFSFFYSFSQNAIMSSSEQKSKPNLFQSIALGGASCVFTVNFTHPIGAFVVVVVVVVAVFLYWVGWLCIFYLFVRSVLTISLDC